MPCEHPAFDSFVGVERTELGYLATVEIVCRECKEPMRWSGLDVGLDHREPTCSADGRVARLPFAPAHNGDELLRCPECARVLFGQAVDDGPGLGRPVAIVGIDCGPDHLVHYADGVSLAVGPDGVRVFDHGDAD